MPNRVLRDWTISTAIDTLSQGGEIFFTRLIMKADDYGSFHGDPRLILANLFPFKRGYTEGQVIDWIRECVAAGLIVEYQADGREYVRINNFGQRLRNMRNVFPSPQVADKSPQLDALKRNETETETRNETNLLTVLECPSFDDFWDAYAKKVDRPKCEKLWTKIKQGAREKIMGHLTAYIPATPDVKFRKDPATYLRNESWNNEVITNGKKPTITKQQRDAYFKSKNKGLPGSGGAIDGDS